MIERGMAYRQELESALAEFDLSLLLNVHFFFFLSISFNKCQALLPGIGISAIGNGNINRATEV